ncbi:BZ3500_MvSof-1268-A1-R1_Chr2-2g04810 [Microbotryum saponariae]|uniref:BZ3500_MvSof-1268-A1-R1_Chr2-2g04810 protein n=1 Tax=Microbotryum saponariae TaxID=289078 RepID=A0A2X0N4S1_9BASI|nr:BZ3500_MvSof-1268-A1-R1_Chr2-2g04810 [Microbotryum saponariae]SDA00216.1 BZ3501_MvSof-1269-A2-R1_Chr2-2g04484 [Microbotryum saponariae]
MADELTRSPSPPCRLLVVKSEQPIQLSQLLTAPAHSIINQASDSRLRLDAGSINADGFGVAWYGPHDDASTPLGPCIFRSITPAWSNSNLHRIAERVKSPLVFAHVRASTTGALSEENTHPWSYYNLVWMHKYDLPYSTLVTGCISEFRKIIRHLQADLSDEYFGVPQGNTDSEWAFACYLERLSKITDPKARTIPHQLLRQAMLETVQLISSYTQRIGVTEPSLMNFCVSDGVSVVSTRYITSATEEVSRLGETFIVATHVLSSSPLLPPLPQAASLFFSTGSMFEEYEPGMFRMTKADKRERIILIASEPLTFERADWVEIPSQSLIVITPQNNLLKYPIVDQFFQHHAVSVRSDRFASRKGYRWNRTVPTANNNPPTTTTTPTTAGTGLGTQGNAVVAPL